MPSKNTKFARHRGYSDIKRLRTNTDETKPAARKDGNYGVKRGVMVDTSAERQKSGKRPYNPSRTNNSHWKKQEEVKPMTKAQMANWRRALAFLHGPAAYDLSDGQVEAARRRVQKSLKL